MRAGSLPRVRPKSNGWTLRCGCCADCLGPLSNHARARNGGVLADSAIFLVRPNIDSRRPSTGSINAITPELNTLRAVNATICTSGALLNNQVVQRNGMRNESTTIAAPRKACPSYFNTLVTSLSWNDDSY